MRHLRLLAPGLAAWLDIPRGQVIHLPALSRLLAAGKALDPEPGLADGLGRAFSVEPQFDLPLAPICARYDGVDAASGYWLRADPAHLQAGMRGMTLLPAAWVGLTLVESVELAAAIAPLFTAAGWRFSAPRPGRWYASPPGEPRLFTTPLDQVAGCLVNKVLPRGPAAPDALRLLNEVQMVLHGHVVNREREARGRAPINTLWFWGGGGMPTVAPRFDALASDVPEARALAELARIPAASCPERYSELSGAARLLAVLPEFSLDADVETAMNLDRDWFRPLLHALRLGRLRRLELSLPGAEGRFVEVGFLGAWKLA